METDPRDIVTKTVQALIESILKPANRKKKKQENRQLFNCDDSMVVMFMFKQDDLVIFKAGQLVPEG